MPDPERPKNAPDNAVEIRDLTKTYAASAKTPSKEALKGITLDIPRGSFFGLLGPNGAGKSTLINIMAGLVTKTSGTVRIWNHDIEADMRTARRAIGVVPQELNIDPFFTPRQTLEQQAGLYGVPKRQRRTDEVLAAVGLTDKAHAYARTLSGGMRRRLLVAKAMVHAPKVLVLDEPTAGVDVELRRHLWQYVRQLNAEGTTVLLTTHYLEEAEELCDHIAIINHGRLIACDATETLLSQLDAKQVAITIASELSAVPDILAKREDFTVELRRANRLVFDYQPSRIDTGAIINAVQAAGLGVLELTTREPELEDIFIRLTRASDESSGYTSVHHAG